MLFHDARLQPARHAVGPLELVDDRLQVVVELDVLLDLLLEQID